jgi:O-methyltransferase involved in polyketide biosynthesis
LCLEANCFIIGIYDLECGDLKESNKYLLKSSNSCSAVVSLPTMDNVDQTKVAHTAVFASMSKASASQATSSASKKLKQQTPLIDRIYSLRRDVVHHLVSSCTSILSDQLIILGAGLDSSYNSLAKEVFHVDFESVISDYNISQAGPNVHLVAADLRNTVDLEVQLLKNGLRANARTVVLIECVLCYLTVDDVRMLLSWISKTLSRSLLIIYDPLVPESAVGAASFTRQMQRGFASRGTPLPAQPHQLLVEAQLAAAGMRTQTRLHRDHGPAAVHLHPAHGSDPGGVASRDRRRRRIRPRV